MSYLYKAEHKIALHAVKMLSKRYDLKIDDSEANFITLHIVNAESNSNMMEMYEITSIIDEILSIVNRNYKIDYEDFAYDRFITHCRFFVQRVVNKEYVEENKKKYVEMFLMMKGLYKSQYRCVNEIAHFIENKYNYQVEDDEKMYLLLHLVKLTT
ncbi:PRD domain-containing protein [Faecalitalea cylindroides]|uniref:PRD domain-containing protein n=1 Tax=Faecalitalea cylindroides TaxID=39483 RepID=UPI00232C2737|nr:PRD domain-containing protein [Faecalitalea cylindroides]MDB7951569.1 PRD domain-containing protein [Faecalitalea cylindroides]MDB7958414.1 PRD domain-containing protein [Faecalitalea cylindroides]MDB7960406.1 PRD domain-containing protein [Faecalitalea cylindroides]MDB7962276.1 PRD domain-containing protein [Faecalitalea cylindroides]MDB7964147.1 PRD domain-containing protein [Faecalitalea cylindroides]